MTKRGMTEGRLGVSREGFRRTRRECGRGGEGGRRSDGREARAKREQVVHYVMPLRAAETRVRDIAAAVRLGKGERDVAGVVHFDSRTISKTRGIISNAKKIRIVVN